MIKIIKNWILKLLPFIVIYLLFLIRFINDNDYEYLIVLIALAPLIAYIFTEDSKLKKNLQYLLYLFVAGIIIYWAFGSYGWISSIFNGNFTVSGFPCFFTGCYGETGWSLFTQSAFFTVDLKIFLYLAVILFAIKSKNRYKNIK